jgi:hypothetical protein
VDIGTVAAILGNSDAIVRKHYGLASVWWTGCQCGQAAEAD